LLKRMHTFMDDYVKSFYNEDEDVQKGIRLKEVHTGYVTANMIALAKEVGLNDKDRALAEVIGLFHDVGRFRQFTLYQTFDDARSEDHADLGLKVLKEQDFFYELSEDEQEIVLFAIGYHNKKVLPKADDRRKLFFAKMIRDADKLDIYRVLLPYLVTDDLQDGLKHWLKFTDTAISPDFIDNFMAGKQADYNAIRTHGDRKIVRLMWAYDINFAWTMKKLVEKGYFEKIIATLPADNEKIKIGVERMQAHIKEKCAEIDKIDF